MDNKKNLLLIVDPQIDFISGTLPVPGAAEAMDKLAEYIKNSHTDFDSCIVTSDWHPYNHSSFEAFGGPWPAHCIQHSEGAAIYPALVKAVNEGFGKLECYYKGDTIDVEEYSIFKNEKSASQFAKHISDRQITDVYLCGIAGDVCVYNTLCDGMEAHPELAFHVLQEYSPSLDGGKLLAEAVEAIEK